MPEAKRASRIELPARPRILVIALRRLGDVLLTTPLIASLRQRLAGCHHRRVGVRRYRRDSARQSRHRWHRFYAGAAQVRPQFTDDGGAVAEIRSCGLDAKRRSAKLFCHYRRTPARGAGRSSLGRPHQASVSPAQRRRFKRSPSHRGNAAAGGRARDRAGSAGGAAANDRSVANTGRPLCRDPCRADVSLQAMDRRWLARTGGRIGCARIVGGGDRRAIGC